MQNPSKYECDRCCHHYVCIMCTTHKAENYSGCDYFMPYLKPVVPFVTYNTETEYRNAWNECVADYKALKDSVVKALEQCLDTVDKSLSGLIDE